MKKLSKKEIESLVEIAKKHIYPVEARGDLETRDNDSEDFLDVSVWSIKAALAAAYELGKENADRRGSERKISLQTSRGQEEALSNLWYGSSCDIASFRDAVEDSRTGAEMVTPILTYADMETLQELVRRLRRAGAKSDATRGCGVHYASSRIIGKIFEKTLFYWLIFRKSFHNNHSQYLFSQSRRDGLLLYSIGAGSGTFICSFAAFKAS